jgi:cytochrome c-type biogenesis protein CcmH
MTWILVLGIAVLLFLAMAFVLRLPRAGWAITATALLIGVAGYALQGSPGLPGSPRAMIEGNSESGAAMVEARQALTGVPLGAGPRWVVVADGLARRGQYEEAAGVLLGAIEQDPTNADAWLALATALTEHSDGTLTPAGIYAFQRAEQAAPGSPGPPFFLGFALATSGRFSEARATWSALLARTPADAPWRPVLAERLGTLDALIARREAAGMPVP